ncbi:MAG: hypothetical protein JRF61_22475 [Deltaproteobacteria bacterium]|nr:hypothetical protein [Deltaproteobacteria bacterium]
MRRCAQLAIAIGLGIATPFLALQTAALAQDEYDDLLGGFDDEFDSSELDLDDEETPAWLAALPFGPWLHEHVDLSGFVEGGLVYSYISHSVPNSDDPTQSTSWGNKISRLDLEGLLQLDVELPYDWRARAEMLGWYDFAYRINGRSEYSGSVIDVYEWQVDSGEVYAAGPLHPNVDLTVGRKVVNWGRSETFRVVDVVNPLDQKEPGLVDIEDLRRPRVMAKLDAQKGPWSTQLIVITERRFARLPPPGSDFFPDLSNLPPAFQQVFRSVSINDRGNFDGTPGLAGRFDGRFSGWDFSIYGAWVDEDQRVLDPEAAFGATPQQTRITAEPNRFGLLGAGANYTRGSWLLKFEGAWRTKIRVLRQRATAPFLVSDDKDRLDSMLGIEYYGPDNLTVVLELVNRHLLNYSHGAGNPPHLLDQTQWEWGLRITRPFFRERMEVTALGVAVGERLQDGGFVRVSADWELTDAWTLDGGVLAFIGGPDKGLGAFEDNDRLFVSLKYSF